jgi:hypothetical protein
MFSVSPVKFPSMPSKSWFESEDHRKWYYHKPKLESEDPVSPEVLNKSLDPCLKTLVSDLLKMGCKTFPSCQGHFHDAEHYENVFDKLFEDSKKIRGKGLNLKNVETGEVLIFQNKNWQLPWQKEDFVSNMLDNEDHEGYLAFTAPDLRLLQHFNDKNGIRCSVKPQSKDFKFEIRVKGENEKDQCAIWKKIAASIKGENTMQENKLRQMVREMLLEQREGFSCPKATQDLRLNTVNRNEAIKAQHIQYGPLNLSDETYWERLADHWNTDVEVAKKSLCGNCSAFDLSPRMDDCMPGQTSDKDGVLGYCWMHAFKCHSARTCYTWAAGGPITKDAISYDWQEREESKQG